MKRMRIATAGASAGLLAVLSACGGGGTSENKSSDDAFVIGVFGPAQIVQGQDIKAGAELAAKHLNAADGIGGREVSIVFCDTENGAKPEKAVACATKFAEEDEADAIVGGFSSAEALAAVDTIVKAETLFLGTGAGATDLVKGVDDEGPRRFIFRVGPVNSLALATDICLAHVGGVAPTAGYTKFGILSEDSEAAVQITEFLKTCLPDPAGATDGRIDAPGVDLVSVQTHAVDATDFSAQFRTLENAGAEYVIEVNSRQVGVALVTQWGQLKPKFGLGGFNVSSQSDDFYKVTNGGAEGELNGPAGVLRTEITAQTIPFYDAFNEMFGHDPIYNAASTYDAVTLLAEAAEVAGSTKTDDLVDALSEIDYTGVQGRIRFDDSHDVIYGAGDPKEGLSPLHFQWTKNGDRRVIFPEAFADGPYTPPSWLN